MNWNITMKRFNGQHLWRHGAVGLLCLTFLVANPLPTPGQGVIGTDSTTGLDLDSLFGPPTNSVTVNPGVTINNSTGDAIFGSATNWNLNNDAAMLNGNNNGVNFQAGGSVNNLSGGRITGNGFYGQGVDINGAGSVTNAGSITGNGIAVLLGGGSVNNEAGGSIAGYNGVEIDGSAGSVDNAGSITGTTNDGVYLSAGGSVNNEVGGTITGNKYYGVQISDGPGSVTNAGAITGGRDGVSLEGGSVNNLSGGTITGNEYDGVEIYGAPGSVINAGSITGTNNDGVDLDGGSVNNLSGGTITGNESDGAGVDILGGGSVNNQAGGTITGSIGVFIGTSPGSVTNAGSIFGGVYLDGGSVNNLAGGTISRNGSGGDGVNDADSVNNAGTITGGYDGVEGGESVNNAGTITGKNDGVDLYGVGSVTNLLDGTVSGGFNGVEIDYGVGYVENAGSITGTTNDGVYLGAGGSVNNLSGGIIAGNGNGVENAGGPGTVINSGSIIGTNGDGVLLDSGSVNNLAGGTIVGNGTTYQAGVAINDGGSVTNAGSITGSYDGVFLGSGGSVNNLAGGTIAGEYNNGVEIDGGAGYVTNAGTITGGYDGVEGGESVNNAGTITGSVIGIYLWQGGSVNNSSTGAITGNGDGVDINGAPGSVANAGLITGDGRGVYLDQGGTVNNLPGGTIIGGVDIGVDIYGAPGSVTNAGSITGSYAGVFLGSGGSVNNLSGGTISEIWNGGYAVAGVDIYGGLGSVINAGSITTTNFVAVDLADGGSVNNLSGGTITGNDAGVVIDGEGGSVNNQAGGTITASGNYGVIFFAGGSVTNAGTITGYYYGVVGAGSVINLSGGIINGNHVVGNGFGGDGVDADSVNNAGTIMGAFDGVEGGESVNNAGTITGNNNDGVDLYGVGSVTNLSGGTIAGGFNGVEIDYGVGYVENTGSITGTTNDGVYLGAGGSVNNLSGGSITGTSSGVEIDGGAGSVYNAGTIIGSDGTAILLDAYNGNTVTLDTGSTVIGNIVGGGTDDAAFLQGTGTYNYGFTNFATLTVQGDASPNGWNLTGNNTFAQNATVQSGLLRINGSLTTPLTEVDAAGGLGGAGVLNGTLDNHGYFAPGNSIGTLTINGSMTNWGNYYADVNAAGNSDLIMVNGAATIKGGDVIVQPESGMYAAQTTYSILTATNGVIGTYVGSSIATNSTAQAGLFPLTSSLLRYDLNDVYLVVSRAPFTSVAQTANQNAVASALDGASQVSSSPTMTNLISQFEGLSSASQAQAALDSMSGEIYGTLATLDVKQQDTFNNSVAQRTGRISAWSQSGEFATSWKPVQLASAGSMLPPMQQAQVNQPLDFWLQGVGTFGHLDSDANAQGGDYTIGGMSGGLDYRVRPELLLGLGAGYTHDSADVGGPDANGSVEAYQVGGYGGYINGPWHLDGILSYGYLHSDTTRFINVGSISQAANGSYDGGVFSLSTEGGYAFKLNWLTAELSIGLNYAHLWQDAFTESGSSGGNNYGLNVNSMDMNSVRSTLGVRLGAQLGQPDRVQFMPSLHTLWAHEFADRYADVNASFVGGSGTFDTHGVELDADTALLGGGLTVAFNKAIQCFVNYDASLNSKLTSSTVSGGLSISW